MRVKGKSVVEYHALVFQLGSSKNESVIKDKGRRIKVKMRERFIEQKERRLVLVRFKDKCDSDIHLLMRERRRLLEEIYRSSKSSEVNNRMSSAKQINRTHGDSGRYKRLYQKDVP